MAAMHCELKVKTLDGGDLNLEVVPATTIKELKAMLFRKKHGGDPIDRKIVRVEVLADRGWLDDDQTVDSAGLLRAESEVTAIFGRNEVEAATKEAIHAEGLLQVNIPSSLTEISAGAFEDCHQVVKVVIPESVTAIGDGAFARCISLASITIPQSVMVIGNSAFQNCKSLASITIPQSVTAIADFAFTDCWSLTSITMHEASVTVIGRSAFARCISLASITVSDGHWGRCLCRLQFFGQHHYPSVSDGHCGLCFCRLQFLGKHHYP